MINTVSGPVPREQLGSALIHEHIICSSSEFQYAFHGEWLPREKVVDIAVAKLRFIAENCGIRTFVDGTPLTLGRDIDLLKEVSERSGVQIIASSGFYFYPCFTAASVPPETMARFLISEVKRPENGIGILKCAVDSDGVTGFVRSYLETIALVHRETGVPIYLHSHSGNRTGLEAQAILAENGVLPERVVVGHVADCGAPEYALELLKRGCFVSVDRIWKANAAAKAEVLRALLESGFAHRVMVSHDHICCRDSIMNSEPAGVESADALGVIHRYFWPELFSKGIDPGVLKQVMVDNTAYFLDIAAQK